jgi:superfamily I DNA and/or RNA helicase
MDGIERHENNTIFNVNEAKIVVEVLKIISNATNNGKTIGVITFYKGQKELLERMILNSNLR